MIEMGFVGALVPGLSHLMAPMPSIFSSSLSMAFYHCLWLGYLATCCLIVGAGVVLVMINGGSTEKFSAVFHCFPGRHCDLHVRQHSLCRILVCIIWLEVDRPVPPNDLDLCFCDNMLRSVVPPVLHYWVWVLLLPF